jgi:hypothetical protein
VEKYLKNKFANTDIVRKETPLKVLHHTGAPKG